jgi:hypothetical protein
MPDMVFGVGPVVVGRKQPKRIPHGTNTSDQQHWGERAAYKRAWTQETHLAVCASMRDRHEWAPRKGIVTVQVTLYVIQKMDPDNAMRAIKGIQDGLKGVLVEDDSEKYLNMLPVRQELVHKRAEERVEVCVKGQDEPKQSQVAE